MGKINQRNANTLMFSQRGFVKSELEDTAEEIIELAKDNIRMRFSDKFGDLEKLMADNIQYEIIQRGFILEARIGILTDGKFSRFISNKEDNEHIFFQAAVDEVRG